MATNTIEATEERAPVNQLFHARSLATPDMVSLTRPNVDTLYSQAYLDLAAEPVLLFKPRTERYCTVQTFDGHSNTPFILGTDGLGGNDEAVYALCGPFWDGALPDGVQAVRMPTDFAWLLLRTKCFGPDDVENVHAVQDAMDTCPLSAFDDKRAGTYRPAPGAYDPARDYVPLEYMANLSLQDYFDRFNRLAQDNPGAAADAPALARFAELGIGAGLAFDLQALGEDVVRATAHLPHLIDRAYSSEHAHITPSNGWMFMDERVGRFGTDYAFRAVVGLRRVRQPRVDGGVSFDGDGRGRRPAARRPSLRAALRAEHDAAARRGRLGGRSRRTPTRAGSSKTSSAATTWERWTTCLSTRTGRSTCSSRRRTPAGGGSAHGFPSAKASSR